MSANPNVAYAAAYQVSIKSKPTAKKLTRADGHAMCRIWQSPQAINTAVGVLITTLPKIATIWLGMVLACLNYAELNIL